MHKHSTVNKRFKGIGKPDSTVYKVGMVSILGVEGGGQKVEMKLKLSPAPRKLQ